MKRKGIVALCVLLLMTLSMHGALADTLEGDWTGKFKASVLPFAMSATVAFTDGAFSISIWGLSATGTYEASDGTITIYPQTFSGVLASQLEAAKDVGSIALQYQLKDGALRIEGSGLGIDGTISLRRK